MTKIPSDFKSLKSNLKKMKIVLIIFTLILFGYMILIFANAKLWINLEYEFKEYWLILALHLSASIIFIWFIWTKIQNDIKSKIIDTIMILFLGVLGIWLWFPNKSEINELTKKNTTHNIG